MDDDKLRGPDCPKCEGPAYTWYAHEFYRCRPCGHKFGPALEKVWEEVREERRKAKVMQQGCRRKNISDD